MTIKNGIKLTTVLLMAARICASNRTMIRLIGCRSAAATAIGFLLPIIKPANGLPAQG